MKKRAHPSTKTRKPEPAREIPKWLWGLTTGLGLTSLFWGGWLTFRPDTSDDLVMPIMGSPQEMKLEFDAPEKTSDVTEEAICPNCDVLLVTVCSLRQDHVGVYVDNEDASTPLKRERSELTPSLDSVADNGFHFSNAFSSSNFTLAGLTSVLTGRYGSSTGVVGWSTGVKDDIPLLPEILGYYGYDTAGFTIDAPSGFRPDYGLHRGFQTMHIIPSPRDTPDGRFRPGEIGEGGAAAEPVLEWMKENEDEAETDRPRFMMFHTRGAHFPFVITDEGAEDDPTEMTQLLWEAGMAQAASTANRAMPGMSGGTAQEGVVEFEGPDPLQVQVERLGEPAELMWKQRYREAVARMDIDLRRVLDGLKNSGRADKTILVVVADHGESLNDHGELLHGDAYFAGVVNVPMVIKVPGLEGKTTALDGLVSHVDLLPTILDLVGAKVPAGIDGTSMVPLLTGESEAIRHTTLIEGGVARQISPIPRGAVISPPWFLIRQERGCGGSITFDPQRNAGEPATCLFNMETDPLQNFNVAKANMDVVKDLLERWNNFRAERSTQARELDLDPAFVDALHRTGYDFHPLTDEEKAAADAASQMSPHAEATPE